MILPSDTETLVFGEEALAGEEPAPRLRLLRCHLERRPSAISRVEVEFSGPGANQRMLGRREGTACPNGDLRLASLATLDAISNATGGKLQLELIGAKPLRAFDSNIIVVAALAHYEGTTTKVIGAAIVDHDVLYATSRATLAAVNRLAVPLLDSLGTTVQV